MAQFLNAAFDVILPADRPVRRLYVDRRTYVILVIDIALLPRCRPGLGAVLLRGLNVEADRPGKLIFGTGERYNRALLLFRRLAFVVTADHGMLLFRWGGVREARELPVPSALKKP